MLANHARRRVATAAVATALALVLAVMAAQAAAGATLYACVKKGGAARVFAHKPKCRRGETRLSWNTPGPRGAQGQRGPTGKPGANGKDGTNGSNGSNGAVTTFFTGEPDGRILFTKLKEPVTVASKTVPAGNYYLIASLKVFGESAKAGAIGVGCELTTGTSLVSSTSDPTLSDFGGGEVVASDPMTLTSVLKPSGSTTVSLVCNEAREVGDVERVGVEAWSLAAIQTSTIG